MIYFALNVVTAKRTHSHPRGPPPSDANPPPSPSLRKHPPSSVRTPPPAHSPRSQGALPHSLNSRNGLTDRDPQDYFDSLEAAARAPAPLADTSKSGSRLA